MKLRKLEIDDAPLMLEWMHDDSVVHDLSTDFSKLTLKDCENFILKSENDTESLHMAIVDETDEYMGTVSLKHIDYNSFSAEFAITIRKAAMGRGVSKYGMSEIIKFGFEELKLKNIYWCVSDNNKRAIRFYDKNGYSRIGLVDLDLEPLRNFYNDAQIKSYIWYQKKNEGVAE